MKAQYLVQIENPERHIVKVTLKLKKAGKDPVRVFLPSWSPGSYLMREYARHVRWFEASQGNGEVLFSAQKEKSVWEIDFNKSDLKTPQDEFQISYEIYCKELTVRTSHVDASHAFLHGPSYLMGVDGQKLENPTIEFRFPPGWSKLSTGLTDISTKREIFIYSAKNYDELIDSPVEIGCHETDGFEFLGKPHHLANYGDIFPHKYNMKEDIKKMVATVARHFDNDLPYDQYLFITHFVPKLYGGLEHLNSTALQFDGRKIPNRKDYLSYLSLVAHEYFHLWNVKRIRPEALGPFNYLSENYTDLLWLAEGLTSFMDDLFLFRAGVGTIEEYVEIVRGNLDVYLNTPGRYFHSLEQSSFNAWVKLYRPDENSRNSSVSYYLKGGLVFLVLHSLLLEKGSSVDDLLKMLWKDYKNRPEKGVNREQVYAMVKELGGEDVLETFSNMVESTLDIDFETAFNKMGCQFKWVENDLPWLGADWEFNGERVFLRTIHMDAPAYRAGLNAGDELLFINGMRIERVDVDRLSTMLQIDTPYEVIASRLGKLVRVELTLSKLPRMLKEIVVVNREVAEKAFHFPSSTKLK